MRAKARKGDVQRIAERVRDVRVAAWIARYITPRLEALTSR